MKKYIVLILVGILNTYGMADSIPTLCQDLLNKSLQKKILGVNDKVKNVFYDINNDGIEEKVVIDSLRENQPLALSFYDKQTNDFIAYAAYEHVRFDEGLQVFRYEDRFYIQHYMTKTQRTPTYVTYINSKNEEIPVCKFKNLKKLILKEHDTTFNTSTCNALLKRYKEGEGVIFDIPSKLKLDIKQKYGFSVQKTHIGDIAYFDFDNDGHKEYIQLFEDTYTMQLFYRKIKDNMETLINNDTLVMATNAWLRYQDKVYFVNGHIKSINNPLWIGLIDNNISKAVCTYNVDTEIMLDINQTESFFKATK